MKAPSDLYQILGLPNFSSPEEIKESFRVLARKHHPDRGGSLQMMQRIANAYNFLKKYKDDYDRALKQALQPQPIVFHFYAHSWGGYPTASTTGNDTGGYTVHYNF